MEHYETQRLLDLDTLARALYRAGELAAMSRWSWEEEMEAERLEGVLWGHGVQVEFGV